MVYPRDFDPTQQLFYAIEVTDTLPRAELICGTRRCKFSFNRDFQPFQKKAYFAPYRIGIREHVHCGFERSS